MAYTLRRDEKGIDDDDEVVLNAFKLYTAKVITKF